MAEDSLKDIAYQMIKDRIVNCVYKPNTFLSENELMKEIDSSRTPIREALNKLEQENLVRILPKRGVIVTEISIKEVKMIFEYRLLIEPYIVENYHSNIDRCALEAILERLSTTPLDEAHYEKFYEMDNQLHRIISNSCPNKYLTGHLSHIYDQNNRLRVLAGKYIHQRQSSATKEHIELINAILYRSAQEAAETLRMHLERSKVAAVESLLDADFSV